MFCKVWIILQDNITLSRTFDIRNMAFFLGSSPRLLIAPQSPLSLPQSASESQGSLFLIEMDTCSPWSAKVHFCFNACLETVQYTSKIVKIVLHFHLGLGYCTSTNVCLLMVSDHGGHLVKVDAWIWLRWGEGIITNYKTGVLMKLLVAFSTSTVVINMIL